MHVTLWRNVNERLPLEDMQLAYHVALVVCSHVGCASFKDLVTATWKNTTNQTSKYFGSGSAVASFGTATAFASA